MPAAIEIDREAVRVLVQAIGVRPAAREMGLSEDTVLAWSRRFGWLDGTRPAIPLPKSMQPTIALTALNTPVKAPADALADVMSDLDSRTKLGFARASVKVAERLADAEPDALLDRATEAQQWAKTASLAHGWVGSAGATVNVAVALRLDMDW